IRDSSVTGVQTCALPILLKNKHTYLTTKQTYSPKDLLQQNKHTYLKTCQSGTTVLAGQDHVHHIILIFPHVHHKTLRSSHLQDKQIINTTGHTPKWQLHHIKDNLSNTTNRQPNNLDKNRMIHLIANNKHNNLTQDKLASHKTLTQNSAKKILLCYKKQKKYININNHKHKQESHKTLTQNSAKMFALCTKQ